ncbi:MAG TPA: hypothetical protein VG754_09690 [Verrucomicrobiae bacterium]|jgi:hypothetical protein|nr:hypothetical protein [Verrucomicrobiae bacterium]
MQHTLARPWNLMFTRHSLAFNPSFFAGAGRKRGPLSFLLNKTALIMTNSASQTMG